MTRARAAWMAWALTVAAVALATRCSGVQVELQMNRTYPATSRAVEGGQVGDLLAQGFVQIGSGKGVGIGRTREEVLQQVLSRAAERGATHIAITEIRTTTDSSICTNVDIQTNPYKYRASDRMFVGKCTSRETRQVPGYEMRVTLFRDAALFGKKIEPVPFVPPEPALTRQEIEKKLDQKCTGGDIEACDGLAVLTNDSARRKQVASLAVSACGRGDRTACFVYANWAIWGLEAAELHRKNCEAGHGPSCVAAGYTYRRTMGHHWEDNSVSDRMWELSLRHGQRGCQDGLAFQCYALGEAIWSGRDRGGTIPVEAANAYARGCLGGYAEACGRLELYWLQEAIPDHRRRALEVHIRGCNIGASLGCKNAQ